MHQRYIRFTLFLIITISIISCSRTGDSNPPPPPPPADTVVKGSVFAIIDGELMRIDPEISTIAWRRPLIDQFNSSESEVNYDSGYVYHRNHTGLTCYNGLSGNVVWSYPWTAFSDGQYYGAVAFNDSLVFFSSPTTAWEPAYLYCLNKRTGVFRWRQQIDLGTWTFNHFYSIPVVAEGKIITLARTANGMRRLQAYSVTGLLLWESPVNNDLMATIKVSGDKIYSTGTAAVAVYLGNGQAAWQTGLNISSPSNYHGNVSFVHQNKLFVAETFGTTNVLKLLDYTTGLNLASGDAPGKTWKANFTNSVLYVSGIVNDTAELNAIDANAQTLKWKYRPYYSGQNVVVSSNRILFIGGPLVNGQPALKLYGLNMEGKKIREMSLPGTYPGRYVYVDENGGIHRDKSY